MLILSIVSIRVANKICPLPVTTLQGSGGLNWFLWSVFKPETVNETSVTGLNEFHCGEVEEMVPSLQRGVLCH